MLRYVARISAKKVVENGDRITCWENVLTFDEFIEKYDSPEFIHGTVVVYIRHHGFDKVASKIDYDKIHTIVVGNHANRKGELDEWIDWMNLTHPDTLAITKRISRII